MKNIEITYDVETGYYDALLVSKGIATQGKTLDELIKNLNDALGLANSTNMYLRKFKISFEENNYVNF